MQYYDPVKHLLKAALGNKIHHSTAEQSCWRWPVPPASPGHKLPMSLSPRKSLPSHILFLHSPIISCTLQPLFTYKATTYIKYPTEPQFSTPLPSKPAISSSNRGRARMPKRFSASPILPNTDRLACHIRTQSPLLSLPQGRLLQHRPL